MTDDQSLAIPSRARGYADPANVYFRRLVDAGREASRVGVPLDRMIVAVAMADAGHDLPDAEFYGEAKRIADEIRSWVPPRRLATDTAAPEGAWMDEQYAENLTEFVRTFETGEHAANALPIFLRSAMHPAAPVAVEGVETVEWGVEWPNGTITSTGWMPGVSDRFARDAMKPRLDRIDPSPPPVRVVSRTRVSYPDRTTEWSPVEPETSEPEGGGSDA